MARVVVVGAGVAGLGAALALGRRGHEVVVLERDATPLPADPHEAFEWDRRGAPQVRHSHAFLARLRNLLRDRHPDVLDALLAAGASELRFTEMLPPTMEDRSAHPGDDDLVALACRRTTFEWVLRTAALDTPNVALRDGVIVDGLVAAPADRSASGAPPRISGVHLDGGEVVDADLVVAANGRRSPLPAWLEAVGAPPVPEVEDDTGIVYFSRFRRLADGAAEPEQQGPIGADLGYLKFAVFKGDNGTFSITLAVNSDDDELRAVLTRPEAFDVAATLMDPIAPWVADGVSEPITGVHPMARLVNRIRRFVVDGEPVATGFVAIGDASVCTNPLYGRGCSLAMVHAELLADALDAHGDAGSAELALAFDEATRRELEPWYVASVSADEANRALASRGGEPDPDDPATFAQSVLRDGVLPASRTDPLVFRAFVRAFNLLVAPEALMADPELMGRVLAVYQERDQREPDPPLGPPRAVLLDELAVRAPAA
jgi:2-polyprenyl-6-methoxyphenol hydroxylase-like FAD-dependent oxidoreductase